jgi:hypothetical protein
MTQERHLPIAHIRATFSAAVESIGGTISDFYEDDTRLFLRSVMPKLREVGVDDRVQAGIALRVANQEVDIDPYIFRLVCTNGAILAQVLSTHQIEHAADLALPELDAGIRHLVELCSAEEIFVNAVQQMRSARNTDASMMLRLLTRMAQQSHAMPERVLQSILNRWTHAADTSRFGLMNAITAEARETRDPAARWGLEELGGQIGILVASDPKKPKPEHQSLELVAN